MTQRKSPDRERRTERLAAALKENLRRRKAQARGRAADECADAAGTASDEVPEKAGRH